MKQNRYYESFRTEAVKLALSGELSYVQIARDLGVNYKTLCNWISQTMKNSPPLKSSWHTAKQTRLSSFRASE